MSLPFLHSPADVVRWLLIDRGLGTDPRLGLSWPVAVADEPDRPDNCLTVFDTTPRDDGRNMVDGESWHHFGYQIRIRAVDHPTGYAKADAIQVAFDEGVYDVVLTVDGSRYLVNVITNQSLTALGKEPESRRQLFVLNALVTLERLS